MYPKPLYQFIASTLLAIQNCEKSENMAWKRIHVARIKGLLDRRFESSHQSFNFEDSSPNRLVFETARQHFTEAGYRDGWTHHCVTAKPSLCFDFELRVTGPNRTDIKDVIHEFFDYMLRTEVTADDIEALDAVIEGG